MDSSCSEDLEFFDLSNATENEIKEIKDILSCNISNGCVELPWDVSISPAENHVQKTEKALGGGIIAPCEPQLPFVTTANSLNTVVGQALLYAPPTMPAAQATQLPMQSLDVLHSVEGFMPTQLPPMTAASPMGPHYPGPFVDPRTLSVLRAYPHVGVPLFTCTLPSTGELTHVASPYAPFLPLAAPVAAVQQTHLEQSMEHEERPKLKGCDDRQFNRRSKKKHTPSGGYYASGSDTYETVLADDQSLPSGGNRLATVPCVPVPLPPSTFPVTSGALPLPSYPPGLHPLSYSHISGHQPPTTPVYYVSLFNPSPYTRYISSATAPMMMPVTSVNLPSATVHHTSESECSIMNDPPENLRSCESLAASTESIAKTSESSAPLESDSETSNELQPTDVRNSTYTPAISKEDATDNSSQKSTETLTKTCRLKNFNKKLSNVIDESGQDRRWADLFKKKCNEMNGVRHPESSNQSEPKEPRSEKDLTNGKMFNVPM